MTSEILRPKLAIFDLDNTLLGGDSDLNWGRFLVNKGIVDAKEYHEKNEYYYAEYEKGRLDIHAFLEFALQPLSQHPLEQLLVWRDEFMQKCIEPMVLPKAVKLVEQHRQQGHQLLIITATNRFVTEPIARRFGINTLLASEPEVVNGNFTGKISGTPCYQNGKITRLQEWLANESIENPEIWFYSDSHNDIPLLSMADHAIAVDADTELQQHAKEQNWQQITLRDEE